MVPCSHARLLKRSTPAIGALTTRSFLSLWFGLGLVPSGPFNVIRFYFAERVTGTPLVDWSLGGVFQRLGFFEVWCLSTVCSIADFEKVDGWKLH